MFYPAASCGGKSVLVRQLRGPHLSTCPWCSKRSSMALTAAASPRFALVFFLVTTFVFAVLNFRTDLEAQFLAHDPGPRGAPVGAGGPVQGLTPTQKSFFEDGLSRFLEIDSVG